MLENFVSSRIRRTLFEYILAHPQEPFYLRGLAKELGLSVTPLRRELKRLEGSGVLKASQEGNMLFYRVDTGSPVFLQLQHAGQSAPSQPVAAGAPSVRTTLVHQELPSMPPVVPSTAPAAVAARVPQAAIPVGIISATRGPSWRNPLSAPMLTVAAGAGLALMLIAVGLFYLTMTNQQLLTQAARMLASRKPQVTVVPQASASGTMHGSRWQVVPGGFGGFSSGGSSSSESY